MTVTLADVARYKAQYIMGRTPETSRTIAWLLALIAANPAARDPSNDAAQDAATPPNH